MSNTMPHWSALLLSAVVRIFGVILMAIGLWIAIYVLDEALKLYDEPLQIDKLALIIEQSSHIDRSMANLQQKPSAKANKDARSTLRLSYFVAWIVGLLLLFLIGHLALSAVKTGGQLALYSMPDKPINAAQKNTE